MFSTPAASKAASNLTSLPSLTAFEIAANCALISKLKSTPFTFQTPSWSALYSALKSNCADLAPLAKS